MKNRITVYASPLGRTVETARIQPDRRLVRGDEDILPRMIADGLRVWCDEWKMRSADIDRAETMKPFIAAMPQRKNVQQEADGCRSGTFCSSGCSGGGRKTA